MRKFKDMMIAFVIVVMMIIITAIILNPSVEASSVVSPSSYRFAKVGETCHPAPDDYFYVLQDTETDMLYLVYDGYEGVGITPLLDSNGKPLKGL